MTISDPIHYKDNIYYVKLSFADGSVVMPTGQSEHRSECQFRISIPDNIQGVWDASNDYSFQGLTQGGEDAMVDTPYITMYDGDTLIWGTEPDGTTPDDNPVTTTTTTATTTTTTTTVTTTAETQKKQPQKPLLRQRLQQAPLHQQQKLQPQSQQKPPQSLTLTSSMGMLIWMVLYL